MNAYKFVRLWTAVRNQVGLKTPGGLLVGHCFARPVIRPQL